MYSHQLTNKTIIGNVTILPALIIIDLECVLVPFKDIYETIALPLSKINGEVVDKDGDVIKCFPEIPAIFEYILKANIKLAVTCESNEIFDGVNDIINILGLDKYISFKEIYPEMYPDYPEDDNRFLINIHLKSKIPFDKIIYFTHWTANIELAKRELGVFSVHVEPEQGMTIKLLNDALRGYELHQQKLSDNITENIITE